MSSTPFCNMPEPLHHVNMEAGFHSDHAIRHIEQILNEEEDMESWSMHHHSLALQAMENTFSQALFTEMQRTPLPGLRGFSIESPYGHTADAPAFVPRNNTYQGTVFGCGNMDEAALNRRENDVEVEAASPMKPYLMMSTSIQKNCQVNAELKELSTLFDRLFLSPSGHVMLKSDVHSKLISNEVGQQLQRSEQTSTDERTVRPKRRRNLKKPANLESLVINCVRAIADDNDNKLAEELLQQIRMHSSPSGNGPQRLGHYFAQGINARLSITGPEVYSALDLKLVPLQDVDLLKAERSFAAVCPFGANSYLFATENILKFANQATALHIIDFGIRIGIHTVGSDCSTSLN